MPEVDGRSTRWDEHRAARRRELVQATLRCVREHGAGIGMDEIAASAGTSKTVFYRHFGDRTGLWLAVVESVHDYILGSLSSPLQEVLDNPVELVITLADAYFAVVERDPEIYRFVTARPAAETWGQGVVGFIWAVADQWMASDMQRPRAALVSDLASLVRPAFTPITTH